MRDGVLTPSDVPRIPKGMAETPSDSSRDNPHIERDEAQMASDAPVKSGELTQLHPNYVKALRITAVITAIPFVIAALVAELAQPLPWPGLIIGLVFVIAITLIIRLPMRRFAARGYDMSADRLRVVRGIWWRSDSVVPFGRVQHIDVEQGPIERSYGIATMTLHTAGTHNASVSLPGLEESLARTMRETIREHIKRDTM